MFVPIVPFVPHTTVVNKTIVYSDTVLPLKDKGSNLKVTTIENVSEAYLESCLKTIFESNPNVVFNTIQYSKNDKTVYFYTNQEITIKEFEESKYTKHKPVTSRSQILEEVKKSLVSDKIKNTDCISLYDVATLISQTEHKYLSIEKSYYSCFDYKIDLEFGSSSSVVIYSFDYDNNELRIGFNYCAGVDDYDDIVFEKKDGDLYISKSESCWDKEVFAAIGVELSQLYDELIKYSAYKKEYCYGINPINSSFVVNISSYGVDIYTKLPTNRFMNDFKLTFTSYGNEYKYDCNSTTVISALRGKENEIFKRIFVKISDCPKWSQPILYEIRQNQLAKEQKIEDKKKYQEMRKGKRLALTRKIFPFLKK